MSDQWGWRGRIGVIYPASGRNEREMAEFLPPGISLHFTRVHIPLRETGVLDDIVASYPDLRRAAKEIAAVDPACVLWPCTAENIRCGEAGEREQASAIAAVCGERVVTAAASVRAALAHLGVTRIGLGAPYPEEVVAGLVAYFESFGITCLTRVALGLAGDRAICALLPEDTYRLASSADHTQAEAVFISCGSMRIQPVLSDIEDELGKPVFTSTMAVMWNGLRALSIAAPFSGMGQLFASRR